MPLTNHPHSCSLFSKAIGIRSFRFARQLSLLCLPGRRDVGCLGLVHFRGPICRAGFLRSYFQRAPTALFKMLLGMAIVLARAIGIETFYNFVHFDPLHRNLEALSEELCEMIGATMLLWGLRAAA
jgi:hypothetical protein